jgi:oxygen-independent coproporphyrinogen-3 oxidase
MKLTLINHDRRFAVEQAVFNYFPKRDGGSATVRLSKNGQFASAAIEYNGKAAYGRAWVPKDARPDNALRMAFYRAAKQLIAPPPWGALTGVRPVKKAIELLDDGRDVVNGLQKIYNVSPGRARMASDCAASAVSLRDKLSRRDIALYIGIPFCPSRCTYCSFVSQSVERDAGLIDRYIDVLREEIKLAGELALSVRTVYWGGGTPAVLSAEQFTLLTDMIKQHISLKHCQEHTVEAGRPDVITGEKLAAYRAAGVTRVSVNPQTLDQSVLDAIGRRHTVEQFFSAYELAQKAGFSINVDLISGLPDEDEEGFIAGLEQVLQLSPENITIHTLARKRASQLHSHIGADVLDGPPLLQLYQAGYSPYYLYRQKFSEGGFENTGWTKPGHACIYNLCMMEELTSVLSLGAGGVSKAVAGGRIERIMHCKYPLEYIGRCDTIKNKITRFMNLMSGE